MSSSPSQDENRWGHEMNDSIRTTVFNDDTMESCRRRSRPVARVRPRATAADVGQ
jgi:hypothetical protein